MSSINTNLQMCCGNQQIISPIAMPAHASSHELLSDIKAFQGDESHENSINLIVIAFGE